LVPVQRLSFSFISLFIAHSFFWSFFFFFAIHVLHDCRVAHRVSRSLYKWYIRTARIHQAQCLFVVLLHIERVCFTIWMHGNGIDPPLDTKAMESLPAAEQMMLQLQQPSMQRYVSKALYSDEYVASLTAAHKEHAGPLLDIHHKDVALIEQTPGLSSMVAFLKDFLKVFITCVAFLTVG
jgi:hypothetical protein